MPDVPSQRTPVSTEDGFAFTVAGRYERLEKIGDGGSSTLYRAIDQETQAELALKCFQMHRAFDAALLPSLREAQALAVTLGPSVLVPLLDVGKDDDGSPYATMPLLKGETLAQRMQRPFTQDDVQRVETALDHAIDALRKAGFTHGDLSEENVFLKEDGGVVLLDHESLGRIGTPRPSRHTEGTPNLTPGLREASDDAEALLALRATLNRRAASPISQYYRYMVTSILLLVLTFLLAWLIQR